MDYQGMKNTILREYGSGEGAQALIERGTHSNRAIVAQLPNGTVFEISFPGFKATAQKPDYRLDIKKGGQPAIPLSHANLIIDIFNKCSTQRQLIPELKLLLSNIIKQGDIDPYLGTTYLRGYQSGPLPTPLLTTQIADVHQRLRKVYGAAGNQWDLTMDELVTAITWIALQEDINYPMPRYEGRRMPFARYVEAVYFAETGGDIGLIVERALSHQRPRPLQGIDYALIQNV